MSNGLQSPEGTAKPEARPQAGENANEAAVPPSQLARLKDFSTVPNTYFQMVEGYVRTTEDITKASLFLVVNYGEGNWYIVTVDTAEYLSYTSQSYLYAYGSWSNAAYLTVKPLSFIKYPGLYLYNGYVCCNGVKKSPGKLMNVHPDWIN